MLIMEYWKKHFNLELVWNFSMLNFYHKILFMSLSFALLNATPGCMDATACNFDSAATEDDGSCEYTNTIICYEDMDGDGFHEGVVLPNAKKIHTACNASCSDLGSSWSEELGNGLSTVRPPLIPEVQAVTGNEKVLLMWDNKAENSIDPFTSYSDFEGYRVYRSSDGGMTWGDSSDDRISN